MNEAITDLRILKTKEKINTALIELLQSNQFDGITVKDICKVANISRGTFYLHYKDKYNLVLKYQESVMQHAKKHFKIHTEFNKKDFIRHAISFWENEGELLLLLISNRGSSEVQQLVRSLLQEHMELNLLPLNYHKYMSQTETHYFLVFLSNAVLGILQDWINNGKKESSEELVEIIDKITSSVLN